MLKLSFWGLNGGLFLMFPRACCRSACCRSGTVYQTGFWYARSAAFYELPLVQQLGTWRVMPDTIIIVLGALPLLYFLLSTYPRLRRPEGPANE